MLRLLCSRPPCRPQLPRYPTGSRSIKHHGASILSKCPRQIRSPASACPISTASGSESGPESRFRVVHVFSVLLALGLGATAFGLYDFYQALTIWPQEVRGDLRSGLRAKSRGDLQLSQRYLIRAWETVRTLPTETLSPEPYLKLSGVAIVLAEVLESDKPSEAYEVYVQALELGQQKQTKVSNPKNESAKGAISSATGTSSPSLSRSERLRTISLALKLGEMAEAYSLPASDEERWLSYAVEEVLRIVRDDHLSTLSGSPPPAASESAEGEKLELPLPHWVTLSKTQLAAPMERLADFYARRENFEYAMPLYQSALQILMKREGPKTPALFADRCAASQVLNNMAGLILNARLHEVLANESLAQQAENYALQAVHISQHTLEEAKSSSRLSEAGLCGPVFAYAAMNLAKIHTILDKSTLENEDYQRIMTALKALKDLGSGTERVFQEMKVEVANMKRKKAISSPSTNPPPTTFANS